MTCRVAAVDCGTNSAALPASLVALVATIRTACAPEPAMTSA